MAEIGWLAAGLRHKIWKDEQMSRLDDLLDNGPTPALPPTVTVRFIDEDGNHLRYQTALTDKGGYVVVVMNPCGQILSKILKIPHMGQYIRTEIEKIIEADNP